MGKHYDHLTADERTQIYALRKAGFSGSAIARQLKRHASTINREINRNSGERGYRPKQASEKALQRKVERAKPRKMTPSVRNYITKRIQVEWSPEQISQRMRAEIGVQVSHEHIYQFILADKRTGGTFYQHLRIANGKRRRKRYGKQDYRGQIPHRVDIDERPKLVNNRCRYGDWEADLVSGSHHRGFLVTLVERKSRLTLIGHCRTKEKDAVTAELIRLLSQSPLPTKTITFDNGREFSSHWQLQDALGCETYFAKPYHSWERGANENTNGLIRQYFPKKSDLRDVTQEELQFVMNRLNNRPRKVLAFMTPNEIVLRRA